MNEPHDTEAEAPGGAESQRGRHSPSATTIGAFSAGVMFIVILLYLAY